MDNLTSKPLFKQMKKMKKAKTKITKKSIVKMAVKKAKKDGKGGPGYGYGKGGPGPTQQKSPTVKTIPASPAQSQQSKNAAEADKIYMKLNPQFARVDGTFPKLNQESPKPQRVAYSNILKQVNMTRKPGGIKKTDMLPSYTKDLGER
jgi:hypothetical protein